MYKRKKFKINYLKIIIIMKKKKKINLINFKQRNHFIMIKIMNNKANKKALLN